MGLLIHRTYCVVIAPFLWGLATIAYVISAPGFAAEAVLDGLRKHWNDQ